MITATLTARAAGVSVCAALLAIVQWPQPAAAFHVTGFSGTVTSVDSVTRQVDINITETTTGSGSPHSAAGVQWGDAMSSLQAWTSTTGVAPKIYKVSASHTYPDIATRVITLFSDSNVPSPLQDTLQVDFGCADTPILLCDASATKAALQIQNNSDDNKDKLKFKWLKGTVPSFDDPTGSTQYFICIYAPGLVLDAIIPSGSPWAAAGSAGFKYQDNTGAAGGMTKIKVKGGTGNAKILVKGQGGNLDDPLPLTQPVLVQVQTSTGQCWQHQFSSPEVESSADKFKDKEP